MAARNVTFAGNSLQTSTIYCKDIDDESMPTKDVKVMALAHANRSKIPFTSHPSKTIKVGGTIYSDTIANLDTALDTFRGYFNGTDQNLDIDYVATIRRYTATVNSLAISRPNGLTFADFSLEFVCTNPFGQSTATTTALTATARTLATYADSHTFIGSAPYQLPLATITFTAITGGTTQSVNFGNNSNGQQITITRTWATNDVLIVDSVNKVVTVNNVITDYSGSFPEFAPGAGSMFYSDGFTTRTFNISVTYNALYL